MEIINPPHRELPNATTIMVLGILSLVFCWCYGVIGLVLGILAVSLSSPQRRTYREHPDDYTEVSYRNMNVGRICGIIGICISAVILLFWVVFFFLFTAGTLAVIESAL